MYEGETTNSSSLKTTLQNEKVNAEKPKTKTEYGLVSKSWLLKKIENEMTCIKCNSKSVQNVLEYGLGAFFGLDLLCFVYSNILGNIGHVSDTHLECVQLGTST